MTALTKIKYRLLSHFANEDTSNPASMIVREVPRGDCYARAPAADYDSIILVLQGEIAAYHQDRRVGLLRKGEAYHLSVMTADLVALHNRSSKPVRFLELAVRPRREIASAAYESVRIDEPTQDLRLIASGAGRDGSMTLHSDVDVYFGSLSKKEVLVHEPQSSQRNLVYVVSGFVDVAGMRLRRFETAFSAREGTRARVICRSPHAEILIIDAA